MKKTLLLLAITLTFVQQTKAQTAQDLTGVGISLFGSSKKQKKIDRENFVIDSTNNALATNKKKREIFVKDSILNVESENRKNEIIKAKELEEKIRHEWNYSECGKCKENPFTLDPIIVKYFVANVYDKDNWNTFGASRDEKDSDEYYKTKVDSAKTAMVSMEVFTDSTTTTKIGEVRLTQVLPTEIFVMLALKKNSGLKMIKSLKDKKVFVIHDYAFDFRDYHYTSGSSIVKMYTNPLTLAKEKLAVTNYRTILNNAILTVDQLEAIQKKHTYKKVNQFGYVISEYYDTTKFAKLEVVTYKQLLKKLKIQRENVITKNKEKVGNKSLQYDLLDLPDYKKQTRIEDAYQSYINDFGYIE